MVGNIVDKHEYGENHEIRYGTRKFRGGTRVVLTPLCWGDGYEQVNVIGLSRYSRKYKKSVIRRDLITNYRVKKIYSPTILKIMEEAENNDNHCWWWDNTEESYQEIIKKRQIVCLFWYNMFVPKYLVNCNVYQPSFQFPLCFSYEDVVEVNIFKYIDFSQNNAHGYGYNPNV